MINRNPKTGAFAAILPCLAAACLAIAGEVSPARAQDPLNPRSALLNMAVSARRTGYEGNKVVIDFSRQAPEITRYRVFHLLPDMERREYADSGRVVVMNNGWLWRYSPKESLIVKKRTPPSDEWDVLRQENLDLVMKNYYIRLSEGMPILGRRSLLVQFDPLVRGSRPIRKFWIDAEKGVPLRAEVYGVDGNLYRLSHFERIKYGASFGPGTFEIREPRARIVEANGAAGECRLRGREAVLGDGDFSRPDTLPAGFVAQCLRKVDEAGGYRYQLLCTDGLSPLSLFQGTGGKPESGRGSGRPIMVGAWPGVEYDLGLLKLIRWHLADRQHVIIGELLEGDLLKIAASVKQQPNRGSGKK